MECEPDEVSEDEGNPPDAAAAIDDEEDDPQYCISLPQTQSSSAVRRSCRKKTDIIYRPEELLESDREQEKTELRSDSKDHSNPSPKVKQKKRRRRRPRLTKNVHSSSHSETSKKQTEDLKEVEIPAVSV